MRYCIVLCLLSLGLRGFGQTAPSMYWVAFQDKVGTPYSVQYPQAFLSDKSMQRRQKNGVAITEQDLPVNPTYVQQVLSATQGRLHHTSKWFNSMTLDLTQLDSLGKVAALDTLSTLGCVREVKVLAEGPVRMSHKYECPQSASSKSYAPWQDSTKYGLGYRQIALINGHRLHEQGLEGQGMDIAQLDNGWQAVPLLPCFEHLYQENRVKLVRDFVHPHSPDVYDGGSHGTWVLGHMAAIIPDTLYGTAPKANFYLFKTEDTNTEFLVEVDNWVAAVELCDSLGVDVINSSLGYSLFDDMDMDFHYNDMNGDVCRGSIAGDIAASKGILIVNSAGNSGDSPWHYLTAPSDGDSVLCIGAVDAWGQHARFSSFGPSYDGDVKPNVSSMGHETYFPVADTTVATGSGTSFSSPITAGAAACLWQAHPDRTNMEIFRAIEKSASCYAHPNDSLGYGIPDFWKAHLLLLSSDSLPNIQIKRVFPNPASDFITVQSTGAPIREARICDLSGRRLLTHAVSPTATVYQHPDAIYLDLEVTSLPCGMYVLYIRTDSGESSTPFEIKRSQ